ncbi:MAG TPA: hypothetical protein VLB04_11195, partial [Methanotrichaceae archaeon]|nr:hypothetical protein [Methanotrichaceae archaeon]
MLIKQQNYLQFLGLLMPGCVTNEETLENLRVYEEWIDSATDEEIREKAQFHYDLWDKLVQEWQADFNPKVPWEEIERDIQELSKDPALSWSEGPIQYGWLAQRINCSILGLPG